MLKKRCVTYVSERLLPIYPVYTLFEFWGKVGIGVIK